MGFSFFDTSCKNRRFASLQPNDYAGDLLRKKNLTLVFTVFANTKTAICIAVAQ